MNSQIPGTHTTPGIGSEFGLSRRGGYQWRILNRPSMDGFSEALLAANGRAAIGLAARHAMQTADPARRTVLMPAYGCGSMLQPLIEQHLNIRFYPVRRDLSMNVADIADRIDDKTLAVVHLHYFGFPHPLSLIEQLVSNFPGLAVIDDRTHLLLTDLSAGDGSSRRTYCVYSTRKWGPFPDLGILLCPSSPVPALEDGFDWAFGFQRLTALLERALFFAYPTESLRRLSLNAYHRGDHILDQRVQLRHASPVSQMLWRLWDWQPVCQRRRANYQYLLDHWPADRARPLFPVLPDHVCPLGFPVLADDRDRLAAHFRTQRIFASAHWPRSPHLPHGQFPEADALFAHELTIPVDQRYGIDDMDRVLDALRTFPG
ncbi:MAG TPA: DegT/DnrJ/EryC1/StrS family aminotransferase [Aggregatilineaceae bacterium]|nr:DegT/DnrJ/EryC1/StrS family aminotransferase [Aggregatilineaceae bacterium]